MPLPHRAEDADQALLPNAETAIEAAASVPAQRRRGRPPGARSRPGPPVAAAAEAAPRDEAESPAGAPPPRRRGRPPGRAPRPAGAAAARRDELTIEQIVAVEPPREPRLSPDGRRVAFTAEAAGARQVFVLDLRSGLARQLTASARAVSDPQWSSDGEWLAYVRDKTVWVVGADGARARSLGEMPGGCRSPRWQPGTRQIAFISRRRGWDQAWIVEAPVPRRGRPPAAAARPAPRALSPAGVDVDDLQWSPDGTRLAYVAHRQADLLTMQVTVVDVASGEDRVVAGTDAWEVSPRWLPDGSGLLLASDESGWFQVVRVPLDGGARVTLTAGRAEHGDYNGSFGMAPLPSPDGTRFVHPVVRDGLVDLVVAPLAAASVRPRRGRPPKHRPPEEAAGAGIRVSPGDGVWLAVAWLPDGEGILAVGEGERDPEDFWILPVPPADGAGGRPARPRRLTRSLPAALPVGAFVDPERLTVRARDGLDIPLTLWRPRGATGRRGGTTVPTVVHVHGGPSWQSFRDFQPFRQLVVQAGMAFLSVDFRGSTGYGRDFRLANRDEWGHADVHDVVDAAHWATSQPWSNGRLAMYGGSYGGYLTLCALVEEPSLWSAGIDMYGDSEIAESYRHGDRVGRLDLQRMMGSPDDPGRAALYRRGSPVYQAERIEAPLLILHGRNDRRVVPLMTERMVEALEIEGKTHEVHWYADEAHGWEGRENRRDAFTRTLDWLRRHLLDEQPPQPS